MKEFIRVNIADAPVREVLDKTVYFKNPDTGRLNKGELRSLRCGEYATVFTARGISHTCEWRDIYEVRKD